MASSTLAIDPTLLPAFLTVVEAGRISAAAKTLHLSQPAVTAQIRKLEEALGVALFVRSVHGVAPTEAGTRLVEYARSIRRLVEEAAMAVSAVEGGDAGDGRGRPLAVGASTTIAAHVLPPILSQFRQMLPNVELQVHVGNTEQVIDEVRAGRIPLGLVEGHRRASGVRLEPFVDDEIVPIVGRSASFRVTTSRDLDTVPILWRETGSGTRAVVERALHRAGLRRRAAQHLDVELGATEAIIGGVMAGLGVGFVSRASVRVHLSAGLVRVVAARDLVVPRTFHWALPAGALQGTALRFHKFAQRAVIA